MGRGRSGLKKNGRSKGIKVFTDMSDSEWSYPGDGKEVVDFFKKNSNFDKLISQMESGETEAFGTWAGGIFMRGQQYNGWDNMSEYEKALTQVFDKYLDQATLDQGVEVTRLSTAELVLGAGKKTATLTELQAMEGSIVTSKGSISTAAAAEGLGIGDGDLKQVEYKITIPPGSKGAGMWIGDRRINDWGTEQREFMMNRDSAYKVGKTTYDSKKDKFIVNVEWAGLMEHDYGTSGKLSDAKLSRALSS